MALIVFFIQYNLKLFPVHLSNRCEFDILACSVCRGVDLKDMHFQIVTSAIIISKNSRTVFHMNIMQQDGGRILNQAFEN